MDKYVLITDLEQRLLPQLIQLVHSPNGYRICLGNWNTAQLISISSVLLSTDSSEALHAVLLDFSRTLVPRIDALWEARKQAKYIEAVANSLKADPITFHTLQRKYKPFSPRPIKVLKVFYGVLLGHVSRVYTSWKEAQPPTIGIRSDFKRFKARQKAEAYVAQQVTLGETPPSSPDAGLNTDGSASLASGTAGWGVYLTRASAPPVSLWGPVVTDLTEPDWIGAPRPTNNTGEISSFIMPSSR